MIGVHKKFIKTKRDTIVKQKFEKKCTLIKVRTVGWDVSKIQTMPREYTSGDCHKSYSERGDIV